MALEGIGRDKIVSIEQLRQLRAAEAQKGKARPAGPAAEETQDAAAPAPSEVRPSAEERDRIMRELKADMEELPDVRRDKVIEAKLRISTGYYNSDEIRREVLRSFLSSLLPKEAVPPEPPAPESPAPEGRP
jgi:hypothetical protein